MRYTTEDISPVKKKITVTVPVEEGEAALATAIAMYRTSVTLDGFRKGKAPSSMVEQRFQREIHGEATTDLVNVHINEIIGAEKFSPVSRIDFEGGEIERGKEFVYSISFEVMPAFTLPAYEGFAVEQEETVINDADVDKVLERLRSGMAEVTTVGEDRLARDGDIAVIDFAAFDADGKPVAGVKADNFQLPLGEGQTLADFENLVRTLKPGESGEGPVSFPADFFNPEFAGKTFTMKATLHALKERRLPELDDAFAQKTGGFENMEKLRANIADSYLKSREKLHKSAAQKELLDSLLKLVDFPLPDTMVAGHVNAMASEILDRLERQGKDLSAIGKTEEGLREEVRPEAELRARAQILLLAVAREAELSVSEAEVDMQLRRMAMESGQDYNAVKDYYVQNNLLFALRDRLLSDKAMEHIFSKAAVTMVPAKTAEA